IESEGLVASQPAPGRNVILRQVPLYAEQRPAFPALRYAELSLAQQGIFDDVMAAVAEARTGRLALGIGNTTSRPTSTFASVGLRLIVRENANDPAVRAYERLKERELRLEQARVLAWRQQRESLYYLTPSFRGDDRLFHDLVSYAPGMNTNAADIRTVLEAETTPGLFGKPGRIDDAARRLFEKARSAGWRSLQLPPDR